MLRFLSWRLGRAILTLWLVLTVVFVGGRLAGNPVDYFLPDGSTPEEEALFMAEWGLDRPLLEQYVIYIEQSLSGNFGESFFELRPVVEDS